MIYTVTVNPALDVTNVCKEPVRPTTLRPDEQWRHAGGKGIDVSRVIRDLGGTSVAMGFLGGFTGKIVEGLLLAEGLELDFVRISQETRTNVIISAPEAGNALVDYRFNSPGPEVQPAEYVELYQKISALSQAGLQKRPTHVAICGSLSKGMQPNFYINIVRQFRDMGAVVYVDTSGTAMKQALRYDPKPHLIKPNISELNELLRGALTPPEIRSSEVCREKGEEGYLNAMCSTSCGRSEDQSLFWSSLLREAYQLSADNDITSMVTLGAGGILLVLEEDGRYVGYHGALAEPVEGFRVVSTVGAGDAALGGLIWARDDGRNWEEALAWAVAAGTAAVTRKGTEAPEKDEVERFLARVDIHRHDTVGVVTVGRRRGPRAATAGSRKDQEQVGAPAAGQKVSSS